MKQMRISFRIDIPGHCIFCPKALVRVSHIEGRSPVSTQKYGIYEQLGL